MYRRPCAKRCAAMAWSLVPPWFASSSPRLAVALTALGKQNARKSACRESQRTDTNAGDLARFLCLTMRVSVRALQALPDDLGRGHEKASGTRPDRPTSWSRPAAFGPYPRSDLTRESDRSRRGRGSPESHPAPLENLAPGALGSGGGYPFTPRSHEPPRQAWLSSPRSGPTADPPKTRLGGANGCPLMVGSTGKPMARVHRGLPVPPRGDAPPIGGTNWVACRRPSALPANLGHDVRPR